MKKIGIIIGSQRVPIDYQYYKKHKKAFDETMTELDIDDLEDFTYDIQIYSILKKVSPKNVEIVPLWKLEFTKQDLDELDLVLCMYEGSYSLRDYGEEGLKKYMRLIKTTKAEVVPTPKFQTFVASKQTYMNYFKKRGIPIMDTIFYNLDTYRKNKSDAKKLFTKATKKFDGPIFCKPELGAFAEGSKLFQKMTEKSLKQYLNKLIKDGYKKLSIQPYISEFLKY